MKQKILFAVTVLLGLSAHAQSVADFNGPSVCQGDTLTLTNNSSSTGNILKTYWDLDGDSLFTDDSVDVIKLANLPAGNYNIGIRVISDIPDTITFFKTVQVFLIPTADFSFVNTTVCLGDSLKIQLNSAPNFLNTTYQWYSNRNDTFSLDRDSFLIYNNTGTVDLKMVATHVNNGCKDSITQSAIIRGSRPLIDVSNTSFCVEESAILRNVTDACGNVLEVQWDLNGDNVFDEGLGDSIIFNSPVAGTFPINMRVLTDRDTTIGSVVLNYEPKPTVGFSVNDTSQLEPINQFNFTNLSSIPGGGLNYLWYFGDGGSTVDPNPSHVYASSGDFEVKLIASSSGSVHCHDSMTLTVNVYPTEASLSVDTVCFGETSVLSNASVSSETPISVEWDLDGDGSFDDGNGNDVSYVFNRFGSIPVRMKLTVASGVYIASGVAEVLPKAFAGFISNEVCEGGLTNFNSLINAAPGVSISRVDWDFESDTVVDLMGANDQTYRYDSGGVFTATQIVYSASGCSDTLSKSVRVFDAPLPDFSVADVCLGQSSQFINNSTSGGDSITLFLWSLGDGNSRKDTGNFSYTYQTDGQYEVELYVQTVRGCNASISKQTEIFPQPQVSIEVNTPSGLPSNPEIVPGDSLDLVVNGNYSSISWVGQNATTNSIRIGEPGTYQVLVSDVNNCSATDEITIAALAIPDMVVRDVITPNGDGINDELHVENLSYFAPVKIKFYHSSGAELYSSDNYQNDWRPEYNTNSLTEGVYFYYAEDRSGNIYKGTISIVK
jgi:gliding motility-associated-like protein